MQTWQGNPQMRSGDPLAKPTGPLCPAHGTKGTQKQTPNPAWPEIPADRDPPGLSSRSGNWERGRVAGAGAARLEHPIRGARRAPGCWWQHSEEPAAASRLLQSPHAWQGQPDCLTLGRPKQAALRSAPNSGHSHTARATPGPTPTNTPRPEPPPCGPNALWAHEGGARGRGAQPVTALGCTRGGQGLHPPEPPGSPALPGRGVAERPWRECGDCDPPEGKQRQTELGPQLLGGSPSPQCYPRRWPLTGLQASVSPWKLHGQAELQCELGLPGRAAAGQLGDAVQGQPAAEEPVQHRAAEAQALVLCGEALGLLLQVEGWRGGQGIRPASPGALLLACSPQGRSFHARALLATALGSP